MLRGLITRRLAPLAETTFLPSGSLDEFPLMVSNYDGDQNNDEMPKQKQSGRYTSSGHTLQNHRGLAGLRNLAPGDVFQSQEQGTVTTTRCDRSRSSCGRRALRSCARSKWTCSVT